MQKRTGILLDFKEIDDFFVKMNRNDIFLTWDTSHYWTCNGNVEELWSKYNSRIKNIHIVDNFDKSSDVHPALGTGKINFSEIFTVTKEYNYSGSMIIEIGSANTLNKSIEFIKNFF